MIIMYEGKMEAIASSYRLKQKYSKTGHLVIQLQRGDAYMSDGVELQRVLMTKLKAFAVK